MAEHSSSLKYLIIAGRALWVIVAIWSIVALALITWTKAWLALANPLGFLVLALASIADPTRGRIHRTGLFIAVGLILLGMIISQIRE